MDEIIEFFVYAGVAQLVEHQLPKLGVAGSNPVSRFDLIISCGAGFKPAICNPASQTNSGSKNENTGFAMPGYKMFFMAT